MRFKAARKTLQQPEWKEGRKGKKKRRERNRIERRKEKKIQEELSGI